MGSARTATPHLFSAVIGVGVAATILFAGRVAVIHLERRTDRALDDFFHGRVPGS